MQFLIKKDIKKTFKLYFFLVIKTLDPDLDSCKMLVPDPDSIDPDPQHKQALCCMVHYIR
jgi:hypothetical protein